MKEDRNTDHFRIETYINEINRLNEEIRNYRLGNRKVKINESTNDMTGTQKVSNVDNYDETVQKIDLRNLCEQDNIGHVNIVMEHQFENYGFSESTDHFDYMQDY